MTIFGNSRLGRIGYLIMLLLMLGFDFAKQPVERYIVGLQDEAARELFAPRPAVDPAQLSQGTVNGRQMPLMLKAQQDAIAEIVASGKKLSNEEINARMRAATIKGLVSFETNHAAPPEIRRLAAARSNYESYYFAAVLLMTGITIIGLLWMVSARLRDIGWPQYLLWILIAPVFLPKFVQIPLSPPLSHGVSLFFYAGIFLLAFLPGEGAVGAPPATKPPPVLIKRRPGQFGRLGTE